MQPTPTCRRKLSVCVVLAMLVGCASVPDVPIPEAPSLAEAIEAAGQAETVVFNAPPAPAVAPRTTLPQCLGITGACQGLCGIVDRIRNMLGMRFPGLEAKPPVLAITDPANMSDDAPTAVKAAAEIKAEEDAAAQKIKALRYLATIGCGGCYPDVEDAMIAGLEDCTEEVRYEAVLAIRATTGVNCCFCTQAACCSEKIQKKLQEIAYDKSGSCCGGEPSARVRRQARMALNQCGPPRVYEEPEPVEPPAPTEAPEETAEPPAPEELAPPADRTTQSSDEASNTVAQVNHQVDRRLASAELLGNRYASITDVVGPRVLPPTYAQ